ncbi:MAG: hypothetical protein KF729_38805 [Sandaracinaceae bacterium]|nr:hypothetical protein [Sandaracinaceae bacterium]
MRQAALALALLVSGCDTTSVDPPRDGGSIGPDAGSSDAAIADAGTDGGATPDASLTDAGAGDAGVAVPTLDERLAALDAASGDRAALDALLHEVGWAEGWPVTDGSRWLFATRWEGAPGPVGLASDVNGWTPAAATRAASGAHYWVVLEQAAFVAPAAGAKYKWRSGETFRAPPEARAYGFDAFGEHGYVAPPTDVRWRERFPDLRSAHLDGPRTLRALLPAGFRHGAAARVLLMHDGQNVFHPDAFFGGWRVDAAVAEPAYEDVVVLAVDNAPDRFDAYTHVADLLRGARVGGRADAYARLLFDEALPFFRAQYGLDTSARRLVVAGSSLGGLVSLYLAMTHERSMQCVIAMSSTLGWGAFDPAADGSDALVRRWPSRGPVAIYLDSGGAGTCVDRDGDGVFEDSDHTDNFCTTLQLRDRLATLGYEHGVDLFHWHERGAAHDEAAWAARMPRALAACADAGWTP